MTATVGLDLPYGETFDFSTDEPDIFLGYDPKNELYLMQILESNSYALLAVADKDDLRLIGAVKDGYQPARVTIQRAFDIAYELAEEGFDVRWVYVVAHVCDGTFRVKENFSITPP